MNIGTFDKYASTMEGQVQGRNRFGPQVGGGLAILRSGLVQTAWTERYARGLENKQYIINEL